MGSKSIREYANEIAKKKIKEHDYKIGDDKKKELDRIYEHALEDELLKESF